MEDFPEGFDGSVWIGDAAYPTSRLKPAEVDTPVQDWVDYNVVFYYPSGKVNQPFVDRLKKSFDRLTFAHEAEATGLEERVSHLNDDQVNTLKIAVYIDYRFQELIDAHEAASVNDNDFLLFIEDPHTGFEHPLIESHGFLIKCGKRAVEILKRGNREDSLVRNVLGNVIPGENPNDQFLLSREILSALERDGSFKGAKTSMDQLTGVTDALASVIFGVQGGITDILGTALLSLIVKPLKNMLTIPSYSWDPMDPAWKKGGSKATMDSSHPDNWLVWYKAPKPDPAQTFFKPYFFEDLWQEDGHIAYEVLDILSGVKLEEYLVGMVRDEVQKRVKEIVKRVQDSFSINIIIDKSRWILEKLGVDVMFLKSWAQTQLGIIKQLFGKIEPAMVEAMESNWDYWFQAKNRFVVLNAFLCGVLNSIVDSILGVPELLGSLFKFTGFLNKANVGLTKEAKFATELGEDIQDFWFPPHGGNPFDIDKAIKQVLSLAKEGTKGLLAIGGYLAREITFVRVAYFVGAIVEMILEIVVSILVTFGFGAIMTFISGLGKFGLIIEKIILAVTKLNKLVNLLPDQMMGVMMKWLGKIYFQVFRLLRGKGDDLIRAVRKIFSSVTNEVDDLIRPAVVKEIREATGIDLNGLQRQTDLHFAGFEDGSLRLIKSICP